MRANRIETRISRAGRQRIYTLVVREASGAEAEVNMTKRDAAMLLRVISEMLGDSIYTQYRVREVK